MDLVQHLVDMQRRLNNLIRIGIVVETNETRLRIKLGDNVTGWLLWLTQRTGDCQTWWKPSINEQVLVLSPSGELNNGVVLPAIYTQNQPTLNPNEQKTVYKDGTTVSYNYEKSKLTVDCVGDVDVIGAKTLKVTFDGNIDIKTPLQVKIDAPNTICTGNLLIQGSLTYMQGMNGFNQDGGATAMIQGKVLVSDDVVANGISQVGHTHIGDSGGRTSAAR
ncbi:phage baseplate assembly protein V [Thiotrichales bacterium 19X7-9]|nr:phage baseplate assembly protein V [Thiotrichales bacterium 19X7-9]